MRCVCKTLHQQIAFATQSSFCAVGQPSLSALTANNPDLYPVDYDIQDMMQVAGALY